MWKIKKFDELNNREIFNIYKLRNQIFVVAQNRIYQDPDDNDLISFHIFAESNGKLMAYARLYKLNNNQVSFGRVVVDPKYRGKGLSTQLMENIMNVVQKYYPKSEIIIESQVQVQGLYEKFGFKTVGEPFIFETTPHIKMVHKPLT